MEKMKAKKIGAVVMDVLLYIFLAVCLLAVVLAIFSKKDADGAANVLGYQMRVVTSDSMAACSLTDVSEYPIGDIPVRSMVLIETVPKDAAKATEWFRSLKVGDVLTFRYLYANQVTITHRITSITEKETGGFHISLAGDNKNSQSGQLYQQIDTSVPDSPNYVIGKVVGKTYLLGLVASLLMQPTGMVLLIILPCTVIILLEIRKVVRTLMAEKKEKAQAEQQEREEKEKELEELRHRLAELEQQPSAAPLAARTLNQNTESKEGESQ